jgi:hypothetical protein
MLQSILSISSQQLRHPVIPNPNDPNPKARYWSKNKDFEVRHTTTNFQTTQTHFEKTKKSHPCPSVPHLWLT